MSSSAQALAPGLATVFAAHILVAFQVVFFRHWTRPVGSTTTDDASNSFRPFGSIIATSDLTSTRVRVPTLVVSLAILILSSHKPRGAARSGRRVYQETDWSLLLMFAGLFIVVAGAQHALLSPGIVAVMGQLHLDQVPVLATVTGALSNFVSNVAAVLMIKPFVDALKDRDRAWLVIAMASTLAGNFTVLGSIANLIVVQRAAASGVAIRFWDYSGSARR